MPALDKIAIRGFKSIADCEVPLAPINVVIGANGSGKSNFIDVFEFLHAIRQGHLQAHVGKAGGADRILHFGSKTTSELFIHISFEDGTNQYKITLSPTDTDELIPTAEVVSFWKKPQHIKPYNESILGHGREARISVAGQTGITHYVQQDLDSWRVYHFHDTSASSPMKKTADLHDNRFLRPDGSNLAAFLYLLRHQHPDAYSLIRRTIRLVAPFFDDFQLEPSKLNPDKIRLEWRHQGSDAYFDASSLSDGTLRFMALSTLFLQPHDYRPSVILIDEPELGLHPYAITMFASLVKQAAARTQVIASTQSSLLLDHFEPGDVLVADRVDQSTQLTRLDDEKLASWLEDYSLGQLWEKNELGGRPGGS